MLKKYDLARLHILGSGKKVGSSRSWMERAPIQCSGGYRLILSDIIFSLSHTCGTLVFSSFISVSLI